MDRFADARDDIMGWFHFVSDVWGHQFDLMFGAISLQIEHHIATDLVLLVDTSGWRNRPKP